MWKEFLQQKLASQYIKHVLNTKEGYAQVISQLADAEGGGGEQTLFSQLKEYVQDPQIKKIVEIHEEDEKRHEEMFLELLKKKKLDIIKVDNQFRLLHHLNLKLNFMNMRVQSDADVILVYTVLKVVEERAVSTYQSYLDSGQSDEDLMLILRRIQEDEKKHLRFCDKVLQIYGTKEKLKSEYARVKEIEEVVYQKVSFSVMQYQIDHGLFKHVREAFFWQIMRFWAMRFAN